MYAVNVYECMCVAAGGAVTLVSSCDVDRGEPELHRWCRGRAPPVSWPRCRLCSQTVSKRSKGMAEIRHVTETANHVHILGSLKQGK